MPESRCDQELIQLILSTVLLPSLPQFRESRFEGTYEMIRRCLHQISFGSGAIW